MYSETSILVSIQGVFILTHPHWELLCFYNLSIWALGGWNMNALQKRNLLFNPGQQSGAVKLLLQSLTTNCSLSASSLLEILDSSKGRSHTCQDDLLYYVSWRAFLWYFLCLPVWTKHHSIHMYMEKHSQLGCPSQHKGQISEGVVQ